MLVIGSAGHDRSSTSAVCHRSRFVAGAVWSAGSRSILLVLLGLVSTYYQVNAEEVGIVQRFGRYTGRAELRPAREAPLRHRAASPRCPCSVSSSRSSASAPPEAGVRTWYKEQDFSDEGRPDAHRGSERRRGRVDRAVPDSGDPYKYLFKVRNLDSADRRGDPSTFRDMNEAVMREIVGDHSVNEVLTVGREKIQIDAKELLQQPVRPVRNRPRGAADRPAGREPARSGQAGVQRGQPGHPGKRTPHQRSLGRLQPDRAERAW